SILRSVGRSSIRPGDGRRSALAVGRFLAAGLHRRADEAEAVLHGDAEVGYDPVLRLGVRAVGEALRRPFFELLHPRQPRGPPPGGPGGGGSRPAPSRPPPPRPRGPARPPSRPRPPVRPSRPSRPRSGSATAAAS